jgi:hypothetical protein
MTDLESIATDGGRELTRFTAIELRSPRTRFDDLALTAIVIAAGIVAMTIVVMAVGVVLAR